jgi:uncharacterized membrane protein
MPPTEEEDSSQESPKGHSRETDQSLTAARSRGNASSQPRKPRTRRIIHEIVRAEVHEELRFFSGPLPPPDILRQYNEIVPGSAETILEMAKNEQAHRHKLDDGESAGGLTLAKRGQLIGGFLAFIAVVGSIYLLETGKSIAGLAVLVGVVATFGTAFVYDRYRSSRSDAQPERSGRDTQSDLPAIGPSDSDPDSN